MKDKNNEISNENELLEINAENEKSADGVESYVENNQDVKSGEKENNEECFSEEEIIDKKGETTEIQEEDTLQESTNDQNKVFEHEKIEKTEENVHKEYSSCYKPPYYVPNFVTVEDNGGNMATSADNKKAQRSGAKKFCRAMLIVCAILLSLCAAFILGAFSKGFFQFNNAVTPDIDLDGEDIVVIKNSPTLYVNENTDVNYVPQSLPEVVQKVGNSVVEISTSSVVTDRFFGQYVTSGAGSGVIITQNDTAGYIITNHHVIEDSDEIIVRLTNKEEYEATLLGSSRALDLAVLRIVKKDKEAFTVANIGDSASLIVGQEIVAIGNPLGSLGGTVTDGIISALDRNVSIDGVSMTLLQHNAAINPGNSGGALFDMMGNLIGIVNAKKSESGIEGLGFAIPVNIAFEYFKGVMQAPSIGAIVDYGYNSERIYGVYVTQVIDGSPFERLDRIIKINDTEIKTLSDYFSCIDDFKTGDSISITVVRNKVEQVIEFTFQQNWFDREE